MNALVKLTSKLCIENDEKYTGCANFSLSSGPNSPVLLKILIPHIQEDSNSPAATRKKNLLAFTCQTDRPA